MADDSGRGAWSSQFGFVLAAVGSAVGLGNIWKFPYKAGVYGGAAFVLVYLFCVVGVGLPLLLAELSVGRAAQRNPVGAYATLRPGSKWQWVGGLGVLAGFVILSYYSVVAGWVLRYLVAAVSGTLSHLKDPAAVQSYFDNFIFTKSTLAYHSVFMGLTVVIVVQGIKTGIERWSKILMPVLALLLVALVLRSVTLPGAAAGVEFLIRPDMSKVLNSEALVVALGHAFFTLSLGMGALITYGSYLKSDHDLPRSSLIIAGLDTGIALLAGLAIFPAVFAFGLNPSEGPGLVFVTLPNVFNEMGSGGHFFMVLFFFLVSIAALTSAISLLEVVCSYFIDEWGWSRTRSALVLGGITFALGVPSAVSARFFDVMEVISSNYMLPIGGLMISLFVGYAWGLPAGIAEIRRGGQSFPTAPLWGILLRYLAPFIVGQIILFNILDQLEVSHASLKTGLATLDAALILIFVLYALYVVVVQRGERATSIGS